MPFANDVGPAGVSRALALAVLTIVASAYMIGWRRLARRSAGTVALWRPLAAAGGLGAFAVATVSPLAEVAHERFTAHMFQHVLMMMIAVPILLIADPFPAVLWSMPRQARGLVGRLLTRAAPLRRYASAIVAPGIAWALSSTLVWLWHLPTLYDLALENEAWHVVEHFAFVAAAVIFWWPVLAPAPRLRRPPSDGTRLAYLVEIIRPGLDGRCVGREERIVVDFVPVPMGTIDLVRADLDQSAAHAHLRYDLAGNGAGRDSRRGFARR